MEEWENDEEDDVVNEAGGQEGHGGDNPHGKDPCGRDGLRLEHVI